MESTSALTCTADAASKSTKIEDVKKVEQQLQREAISEFVHFQWVKTRTSAEATKFIMFWIDQIETLVNECNGLRAYYAAEQVIKIRLKYGKTPEKKRMQ
uniref:Ovule protein n=1 Tax=Panagrellus redivivus TaxID=6233 RepID=A0A7E4VD75_PANRE